MCLILGHVSPEYNFDRKGKQLWKLKNIWLNLEPVPGIQNVVSVKIKIATVEYSSSNSNPPSPPKKIVQGICSPKQNLAEAEAVKKKVLQDEKVAVPHHFSNGPSLNSVFWFANSFSKRIRFPPIKIHTTWGLIVNFVVKLCCFSCENSSFGWC